MGIDSVSIMENRYYYDNRKQISFLNFCRDVIISLLPEKLSPCIRACLPYTPDFIFLTHPRNESDILATSPIYRLLRRFLSEKHAHNVLNLSPCYIISQVLGPQGTRGYVISVSELPQDLFMYRQKTSMLINRLISFFRKISKQRVYVGLAAWWPIVSNSGLFFTKHLNQKDAIRITSGHTATLASIYLSVKKIAELIRVPEKHLKVLVLGIGKVGGGFCEVINGSVGKLGLLDTNQIRLKSFINKLQKSNTNQTIELIHVTEKDSENIIFDKLAEYDIAVCATSNAGLLIRDGNKLKNCIILDDSRPEAFPRIFSKERRVAVIEGGLMKIPGVVLDSDFGFGSNDNIFGCLSEAIILTLDQEKKLMPNVGEIDVKNLFDLIEFCNRHGIKHGDFKCGQQTIELDSFSRQQESR